VYALLFGGFLLCAGLVWAVPFDRMGADMLPLMRDADSFLLAGQNPYGQSYSNHFYYLPLQWLAYLPLVVADLDLRILNLACLAAVDALIVWLVHRRRLSPLALLSVCPIMVSRSAAEMVVQGQVWPYWALVVAFVAAMLFQARTLTAILLGSLLATQQPAFVIALLFGGYIIFRQKVADSAKMIVIAGLIWGILFVPWAIATPDLPYDLFVGIQRTIAQEHFLAPHWDWVQVSVLNLLQSAGLLWVRPLLQAAIVGTALIVLAFARSVRLSTFICTAGFVYLCAISLNVQVFKYYYYPGLFLVAMGLAITPDGELSWTSGNWIRRPRQDDLFAA
jgi:hypothetical protein